MNATPVFARGASAADADLTGSHGRLYRRILFDRIIGWILLLAFVAVLFPLFDVIYWVSEKALPTMTVATFTQNQVGTGGGLYFAIVGTFVILGLALAVSVAIGIGAGLYTSEYAGPTARRVGRVAGNVLAGVPAIVLGYFGYFLLVIYTHWGFTTFAGGLTLGIFMTPYIYRTTDVALSNVPTNQREAALAMGSRRHQYLLRVAFPIAFPTILSGVFFAMALGLGEAACVLYTAGWSTVPLTGLFSSTGFLTGAVWEYFDFPSNYGQFQALAFQAAFLLFVIILALNVVVQVFSDRYRQRLRGLYQ